MYKESYKNDKIRALQMCTCSPNGFGFYKNTIEDKTLILLETPSDISHNNITWYRCF